MQKRQLCPELRRTNPKDDLRPEHLEDLRRSGLTDETIASAGIRSLSEDELELALAECGWRELQPYASAYVIPYGDGFYRLRMHYAEKAEELKEKLGKEPPKYLQPKGTGVRLYVPPGVKAFQGKAHVPLWVTEGEKKALRLAQEGIAAVALGGVWNFRNPDRTDLMPELQEWLPELQECFTELQEWDGRGRRVYLAFDADLWEKPQVQDALYEFACRLAARDAVVHVVTWAPEIGKGIDDALESGKATLKELQDEALPLPNFVRKHGTLHRIAVLRALKIVQLPPTVRSALINALAAALKVRPKAVLAEVLERPAESLEPKPPAREPIPPLLFAPDFVERYLFAIRVVHPGDDEGALALLLSWGSLRSEDPVSVVVMGHPSTGKNHLLRTSCSLWPEESYVFLSSISPKSLAYLDDNLSHRALVLAEAVSIVGEDEKGYLLRTLLSEKRIVHVTVEKTPQGLRSHRLEKEGPTALICTTTAQQIEEQLRTRVWVLESKSDAEYLGTAQDCIWEVAPAGGAGPEAAAEIEALRKEIREALRWLYVYGETRVVIPEPMRRALRKLFPDRAPKELRLAVRLRRTIEASAFLHQLQRPRDANGAIVATEEDYAIARRALYRAFATALSDLTPRQREVLQTLHSLDDGSGVSRADLAEALNMDKGSVRKYLKVLQRKGYAAQDAATGKWRALEQPDVECVLPERLDLPEGTGEKASPEPETHGNPAQPDADTADTPSPDFSVNPTPGPPVEPGGSLRVQQEALLWAEPEPSGEAPAKPVPAEPLPPALIPAESLPPEKLAELTRRFVGLPHVGCKNGGKFEWVCPGWVRCDGCEDYFRIAGVQDSSAPWHYEFRDVVGEGAAIGAALNGPEPLPSAPNGETPNGGRSGARRRIWNRQHSRERKKPELLQAHRNGR